MLLRFIDLALPLRVAIVLAIAVLAARWINWAIYSWAFYRRNLGPWVPTPSGAPRTWLDHCPVLGWYRLRGESSTHGKGYWIRPLLIEGLFPLLIAGYYVFYVSGGSLPAGMAMRVAAPGVQSALHWQFLAHLVLFVLMTIATFIDFDEQSIPDYVTIPGTVIGLLGAALAPAWLPFHPSAGGLVELHSGVPDGWWLELNQRLGLWLGCAIALVWGFALLDRRWIGRHGFLRGVQFFFARMFRNRRLWGTVLAVTGLMLLGVCLGWTFLNPGRWTYLLSSLFGLAFAGGVTWGVRLSASAGLGVEALGFGDVTLMAMIGCYLGWQPSLLVFFIAPMVAILFVLIRWIVTGDAATPYGPYLCAAAVLVLVFWNALWTDWVAVVFELGAVILMIVVACVALMGAMLWIWRLIKEVTGLAGH